MRLRSHARRWPHSIHGNGICFYRCSLNCGEGNTHHALACLTAWRVLIFLSRGECDLPFRRHSQESRPVHQGRTMSTIEPNLPHSPPRSKFLIWFAGAASAIAIAVGALYAIFVPGLSRAVREPPAAETPIAAWLLHHSVPDIAKRSVNPLRAGTGSLKDDPASIAAGK